MRFQETTFRPLFGRVLSIAIAALGAFTVIATAVSGDGVAALRAAAPVALVVVLTVAAFWRPHVSVRRDAIEIGNVFSTQIVPWQAIRRIDTKWALALETDRGTVTAWASPAPGRHAVLGMARSDVRGAASSARAAGGSIRPGDALSTESGAAAHVIRSQWEQLRDDDLLDAPGAGTGPTRRWHTGTVVAVVALAIASVPSLAL